MGDFEYALVFYHRGHKLRPELQEFRLGIQKAQEAINNCVGSKYGKLTTEFNNFISVAEMKKFILICRLFCFLVFYFILKRKAYKRILTLKKTKKLK